MATGISSSLLEHDFLECQICLGPYRRPKVLSCLHTFCQECLERLLERQEQQHELECPTCRTKTELPGPGVAALKDNFFVESLKDTVKLHKTVKETEGGSTSSALHVCSLCESGGEAKSYCVECAELLCDGCITVHGRLKALKGHQVISMEEVRSGEGLRAAKPRTKPCRLHKDESLKFYCETCGEAVCRDCIMVEHKNHSYTNLSKAFAGIKQELAASLVEDADKRIAELKDKQQEVLSRKSLLKDTVAHVQDQINKASEQTRHRLKRLLQLVNAEEKYLLQKVQGIEKKTEKEFCMVQDSLETTIVILSRMTEFGRNIIAHGTDLKHITIVKREIQYRLQRQLQIHAPAGEPWVQFVADRAMKIDDDITLVGDIIEPGEDIEGDVMELLEDFQQILESILSQLEETDVRLLLRVWSARTAKQGSSVIVASPDVMKDMMKREYITTGDLRALEKDMMAAGISFPAVVQDTPG